MNKTELIAVLEASLDNGDLQQPVSSALSLIRGHDQVSIVDHGEKGSAGKDNILSTYRFRQKRLLTTGTVLLGFNETILSLANCHAQRINLIMVTVANKFIAIWLTPSKSVVGCFFGKETGEATEEWFK